MPTAHVLPQDLEAFCHQAMLRLGVQEDDARLGAQILTMTDTWGVHTHGTRQLRNLLKNFKVNRLDPNERAQIVREGPAWALVDGRNAMPLGTAYRAMELAISKAKANGIGYVGVYNTSHFGAAGYYTNMAAQQQMIGIAMCNTDPQMTAPGGRGKVLGTNPLSYAAPGGNHPAVFLDIATSAAAANKVIRARALGEPIPEGWLVDADGIPTTDPGGFPESGALMPMAGHKGYGFAVLVEVLCGVLTGASIGKEQASWIPYDDSSVPVNQGQTFIVIDAGAMMPADTFKERMNALIDYIHGSPRARGIDQIYLPGEIEWKKRAAVLERGMTLPSDVVESLRGLAADAGLEFPFALID